MLAPDIGLDVPTNAQEHRHAAPPGDPQCKARDRMNSTAHQDVPTGHPILKQLCDLREQNGTFEAECSQIWIPWQVTHAKQRGIQKIWRAMRYGQHSRAEVNSLEPSWSKGFHKSDEGLIRRIHSRVLEYYLIKNQAKTHETLARENHPLRLQISRIIPAPYPRCSIMKLTAI